MGSKQDTINKIIEKYGGPDKRMSVINTITRSTEISKVINTCKDEKEKAVLKKMYRGVMTDYHSK